MNTITTEDQPERLADVIQLADQRARRRWQAVLEEEAALRGLPPRPGELRYAGGPGSGS